MGSVLATGPIAVPNPPVGTIPPPPPVTSTGGSHTTATGGSLPEQPSDQSGSSAQQLVSDAEVEKTDSLNPGTFEDLHKKCKGDTSKWFCYFHSCYRPISM